MANCETSKKRGPRQRHLPLTVVIQKQFRIRCDHCGKMFNTFCFYKYTSTGFPLLDFENDFLVLRERLTAGLFEECGTLDYSSSRV